MTEGTYTLTRSDIWTKHSSLPRALCVCDRDGVNVESASAMDWVVQIALYQPEGLPHFGTGFPVIWHIVCMVLR
jgi:hypothetical protein